MVLKRLGTAVIEDSLKNRKYVRVQRSKLANWLEAIERQQKLK